ncbi:hypothetical protein RYX36_033114 [Vicia faba]
MRQRLHQERLQARHFIYCVFLENRSGGFGGGVFLENRSGGFGGDDSGCFCGGGTAGDYEILIGETGDDGCSKEDLNGGFNGRSDGFGGGEGPRD